MKKRKAIIFDIDGTICDISEQRKVVMDLQDWEAFYSLSVFEYPLPSVVDKLVDYAREGYRIVLITARPVEKRDITIAWLEKFKIPFDRIIFRPLGDKRRSYIVKSVALKTVLQNYFVEAVYDDRDQDIAMYKGHDLIVYKVVDGVVQ